MKSNVTVREEEVQRFLSRYIDSVKSADGCVLESNRHICDALWTLFCYPNLQLQEFCSHLANFPFLGVAEAACCEGMITECEVCDALKLPGLDALRSLLEAAALAYSDGYVQPLVRPGSHPW